MARRTLFPLLCCIAFAGCRGSVRKPQPPTAIDLSQRKECRSAEVIAACIMQCNRQHGQSCFVLALAYDSGRFYGLRQNPLRARRYYALSCQYRFGDGCYQLGYQLFEGSSGEKSAPQRGLLLMSTGCAYGSARACFYLGNAYRSGIEKVLRADRLRANQFFRRACALGYQRACAKDPRAFP